MAILPNYEREERPWGFFERFTYNEPSTVKILRVFPEKRFSLQRHHKRSEFWRVIEGSGTLELNEETRELKVGDEVLIESEAAHRLTGGPEGIAILEIWVGESGEEDIERIEDDFGRA